MTPRADTEGLLVQVMLRSAQRLLAALDLEPPDPRTRDRASEVLRLSFAPIWSRLPFVELEIEDAGVLWDGQPVLEPADDREGLLGTLRRGGITSLTLVPGVERTEIHQLVLAVREARAERPGADLATLLFRADLQVLGYRLGEGADERAGGAPGVATFSPTPSPARPAAAPAVRDAVREDAARPEAPRGIVQLEKYDSTLYFLEPREIEQLRSAIDREYTQDFAMSALALLLDTLELRAEPDVRDEALAVLADLLPHLLAEGRFDAVAYLMAETREVTQRAADLRPPQKEALDALRASVSEPRAVAQLFHALDDGGVRPTAESMGILLRELRPQAIRQILGWSELLSDPDAKHAVTSSLEAFFTAWPHALSRMLNASELDSVRAALELVGRLRLPGFVEPVSEIAAHPDPRVRVLVARALAAIGSGPSLRRLLGMADDSEGAVRLEVWQTFAARPLRGALGTLETALASKGLEKLGEQEKRALFGAYGAVAGAEGVETLASMLGGRSPSGLRLSAHSRACAAVALGVIGTPLARKTLEGAATDRDPVVRAAVGSALRGEGA